ncbi:MAG: hypothetical protein HQM11_01795 [SAR324 cluster bacterium]|nr:hypothetical protein [SAR324 cluster bacterium]
MSPESSNSGFDPQADLMRELLRETSATDQDQTQSDLISDLLAEMSPVTNEGLLSEIMQSAGNVPAMASAASGQAPSKPVPIYVRPAEFVMADWNMDRMYRSFETVFKTILEASQQADQWIDHTKKELLRIIEELPDVWPQQDSHNITSRLLGHFYAITQQNPVAQYLECFAPIQQLPGSFPVLFDLKSPEEIIRRHFDQAPRFAHLWMFWKGGMPEQYLKNRLGTGSWWQKRIWQWYRHNQELLRKNIRQLRKNVRFRAIGIYWLRYENALQMQGTLRDAGDFYFIFLKSFQRLFSVQPGEDLTYIREEMTGDVQELADHLKSVHRGHLLYIYSGFEQELQKAVLPWTSSRSIRTVKLLRGLDKLLNENQESLEQYSRALEYALEDFYIRLQFVQIQRDAYKLIEDDLVLVQRQYERLIKQLDDSSLKVQKCIPDRETEWEKMNKHMFSYSMNKVQTTCYASVERLRNVFSQIDANTRTNNLVDLVLGKYAKISQKLPEHANIVHLDKLWSWTNKKIEIDEGFPLRYTVENYLYTNLYDSLNQFHQRWLGYIKAWSNQADQQEQFIQFSFYSLRHEHSDPVTDWQESNRNKLYKELTDVITPTLEHFQNIHQELEKEFPLFQKNTLRCVQESLINLENVIFDPGLREKLTRIANEGEGFLANALRTLIKLKQVNFLLKLPRIRQFSSVLEQAKTHLDEIFFYFRKKEKPLESAAPVYYSRVFMIEPLEVPSLFIEREELHQLMRIWHGQNKAERTVTAVVGQPGFGRRSMIQYFLYEKTNRSHIRVQLTLTDEGIMAMMNNQSFSLDKMLHKVQIDRFEIVVLEGIESCYIESAGGAEHLKRFFSWLQQVTGKIFWLVSINELTWKTISLLEQISGAFTHVIRLTPMDQKNIHDMLQRRHNVVGLQLKYKPPETIPYYWFNRLRPVDCQKWLMWRFINELEHRSGGNPALAIQLWMQQIRMVDSGTMLLLPFQKQLVLPELEEDELLILRIILTQGPVGAYHLRPAVVSSKYLRICLDKLKMMGLIIIRKYNHVTVFSANPNAYQMIYQLLHEAMLLT